MNLSKQIRKYRARDNLSQEALAEKIYVSRQTISNWENERSYPDIHSLLLLSVLFDASLDELVKGDVEVMKKETGQGKLKSWSYFMLVFMILTPLSIPPALKWLGLAGLSIPAVFAAAMTLAAVKLEKMKKKNNIETYSEILAFMESREVDPEKNERDKRNKLRAAALKLVVSASAAVILLAVSFFVVNML